MKPLLQKKELIFITAVLALACILYAGNRLLHQKEAAIVEVSIGGTAVASFDLNTDTEYTAKGSEGGSNHLIIKDGSVWCSDASCPDQICVLQGKQSMDGEMIVCLPNEMIVTITGRE